MSKIYFGTNIQITNGDTLGKDTFEKNFKSNLTHVYHLPNGVKNTSNLFNGCINLKDFVGKLPDTIENMDGMFKDCKNLNIIAQIPNNVKNMKSAYENTSVYGDLRIDHSIKNLDYSFKNTKVNSVNFYVEYNSEADETTGVSAFENCINLKTLRGEIEKRNSINMFHNSSLENIDISFRGGNSSNMFRNCNNLQTANFDNDINIDNGDNMFEDCKNLKTVNFNNSIRLTDGNNMFENCISLQTAHFNDKIILNNAHSMFKNCINLQNFDSTIKIYNGNEVFANCKQLINMNSLTIFNSINLFQNCTNLLNFQMNLFELGKNKIYFNNLFSGTNIKKIILNPIYSFGWKLEEYTPDTTKILEWELKNENLNGDTYIEMNGTKHSYLSDCLIRNMFSTNSHPYYKSGYFDISQYKYTNNNGEISIDQYNDELSSLSSLVADVRYRSNPLDKNTETTITYNANVFKDIRTISNIFYLGELNTSLFENSTVENFITNKNNIDIPHSCFNNCTRLLNLYTGDLLKPTCMTVKNIGNYSFYNCQKLNVLNTITTGISYKIEYNGINGINVKALDLSCYNISNMKSVVLQNLTNLKINGYINYFITEKNDASNKIIGYNFGKIDNITDCGYTIIDNIYRNCTINYLNVSNAKNIGNHAFYDSDIKNIILGNNIQSIGNHAFHNTIIYNFNSCFHNYFCNFKNDGDYSSHYCWNQLTIYTNGLSYINADMSSLDASTAIKSITVNDKTSFRFCGNVNGSFVFNMSKCENLYIDKLSGGTNEKIFNLKNNVNIYIKEFGYSKSFISNVNINNLFIKDLSLNNTYSYINNSFLTTSSTDVSNGIIMSSGKKISNFLINTTKNMGQNFYYNIINNFYIYDTYDLCYSISNNITIDSLKSLYTHIYTRNLDFDKYYKNNVCFKNIKFHYDNKLIVNAYSNGMFKNLSLDPNITKEETITFPTFPIFNNVIPIS